jgi:hypothetical protein
MIKTDQVRPFFDHGRDGQHRSLLHYTQHKKKVYVKFLVFNKEEEKRGLLLCVPQHFPNTNRLN